MFAISLWNLMGGHVTLGSILALFIVVVLHSGHRNVVLSIILYLVIAIALWMVGDWIFGAYPLLSTTELPRY